MRVGFLLNDNHLRLLRLRRPDKLANLVNQLLLVRRARATPHGK
jgi:hypothetical protein